ncbi:hypothetical protein IMCC20628_03089 [Hoeflea sp. IMCC20628]|nr:hypothetical protein IMCC20628_03089 [Hoeflea sp. IMCC20628]
MMRVAKSDSETAILHGATPIPMCGVSILKAETAIHTRTAVAAGDYLVGLIYPGRRWWMTMSCTLPLMPSDWQHLVCKAIQIGAIDFASDQVADNLMQITSIYPSAIPISR